MFLTAFSPPPWDLKMESPQVLSLGCVNTPPRQPRAPSTPGAPRRQVRGPFQSPRFVSNTGLSRRLFVAPDSSSQPPAAEASDVGLDDPDACQVCDMLAELAALRADQDNMDTE
jgi:hypothetical protein